jgi:hypothetical protein
MLTTSRVAALVILFAAATGAHQPFAASNVPNPTVIGPIPASVAPGDPSHDYPFFSTSADLASQGYVEEEYFFEGTANRYAISPLATAVVLDGGHPYRTRMIVRRPTSADRFNGTVLMEWQNNALNYDIDGLWTFGHAHILRRGYAWVGVSAFRAGVHAPAVGLKAWSPSRYRTLDVTGGGAIADDALSFDIFSHAGQSVKYPVGTDPMGGLPVERVFAFGASQAASKGLVPYHNAIHPLAGVFDGFLPVIGGVNAALRTDLDVNVLKVWTESEAANSTFDGRQPDSDRLRRWEVAGAAHFGWQFVQAVRPLQQRDLNVSPVFSCDLPPFSRVPFTHVVNAALDAMVAWVASGTQPPHAPEVEIVAFGSPNVIARDNFGNALGGIRLPEHAVATATNTGLNGPATNFCRTFGSHEPFDQATLDALYRNHGTYVSQVAQTAEQNLQDGFLVREDAMATIQEASQSVVGKQ